jgi:hypothetical protein
VAIAAAVQGKEVPGQISVLYQHLMPDVRDTHGDVVEAVKANVVSDETGAGELDGDREGSERGRRKGGRWSV